ncbi:holin [Buttiauxella sp. 3AFRM03]|uniref:holin n=1 Tax=Buttiauxella sp. 3AFRM03 TaxID=2479367 RepID=UPI000EF7A59A|nr:holin [Buttiauxella sp. 3AFRM03]AYN26544.1 holin [Buttiauxella sp. 3AFRM03]
MPQNHFRNLLTLAFVGGIIGLARLMESGDPLSGRLIFARTILGSAMALVAGIVLIRIPDIHPMAMLGIASALAVAGPQCIEKWLRWRVREREASHK